MERNRELLAAMVARRKQEEELAKAAADLATERRRRFKESLLTRASERRSSVEAAETLPAQDLGDRRADLRDKLSLQKEKDAKSARTAGSQHASPPRRRLSARELSSELNDEDFGAKSSWGRISWTDRDDLGLLLDPLSPAARTRSLSTTPRASSEEDALTSPITSFHSKTPCEVSDSLEATQVPVGSAVRAVRSRKLSRAEDPQTGAGVQDRGVEAEAAASAEREERRRRRLLVKEHKNRLQQYLDNLTQEKKAKEEERLMKEKVSKKRRELLAVRVYNEAMERKLMAREDRGAEAMPSKANAGEMKEQKSLKITPELSDAIYNRLVAKRSKTVEASESLAKASVSVRDFAEWKKRHALPSDTKVFSISGWFPCVKEALLTRGWFQNKDSSSPYFDLKWTNKTMDIEHESLQPWQLANHFTKNVSITTKIGLLKSLNSLIWAADVRSDDIAPRSYDLSNEGELDDFVQDFKLQRAQCILKKIYFSSTGINDLPKCKINGSTVHDVDCLSCFPPPPPPTQSLLVNKAVLNTACNVLQRHLRTLDVNNVDDVEGMRGVSPVEWEVLGYDAFAVHIMPPAPPESDLMTEIRNKEGMGLAELKQWKSQRKADLALRAMSRADIGQWTAVGEDVIVTLHGILLQLREAEGAQSRINGNFAVAKNIWIVKPAAKSRGRGICSFTDLNKLLQYVEAGTTISAQNLWIVQKYIENPLVIADRKFDIRQWVLVTDWNPLTIYIYQEFYARFSVEKYRYSQYP